MQKLRTADGMAFLSVDECCHSAIKNDKINTWKYQRMFIWMRYCNREMLLPPPMNVLDFIITLPLRIVRWAKWTKFSVNRTLKNKG